MPRMSEEVAQNVSWLATQDKFMSLIGHFENIRDELQIQVNDPMTPTSEREITVYLMQQIQKEVIDVTKTAMDILAKTEKYTNKGDS